MSDSDNCGQDSRDSDFRPRALAEMAVAIRNDADRDTGLGDTADLIALGGGLEALDAVVFTLGHDQPFDPRPGQEALQMAHIMAALTDDMERAKQATAENAKSEETSADLVPELAT